MTQFEVVQRYRALIPRYASAFSWRSPNEGHIKVFRELQREITPTMWDRYADYVGSGGWYPAPMDAGWVARTCRKLFVVENTP